MTTKAKALLINFIDGLTKPQFSVVGVLAAVFIYQFLSDSLFREVQLVEYKVIFMIIVMIFAAAFGTMFWLAYVGLLAAKSYLERKQNEQ